MGTGDRNVEIFVVIALGVAGLLAVVAANTAADNRDAGSWWVAVGGVAFLGIFVWFVRLVLHPLTVRTSVWRSRVLADARSANPHKAGALIEEITKASWGSGETFKDVTDRVSKQVNNGRLDMFAAPSLLSDPTPNVFKTLSVEYRVDGWSYTQNYQENDRVVLP